MNPQLPFPRNTLTVDRTWINNVPPPGSFYWDWVRLVALALPPEQRSTISDFMVDTTLASAFMERDIHRAIGTSIFGAPITTRQTNTRFRKVLQSRSRFGALSPVAWGLWLFCR